MKNEIWLLLAAFLLEATVLGGNTQHDAGGRRQIAASSILMPTDTHGDDVSREQEENVTIITPVGNRNTGDDLLEASPQKSDTETGRTIAAAGGGASNPPARDPPLGRVGKEGSEDIAAPQRGG